MQIDQAFQLALQHHQAGQLPQAENLYRQILTQHPKHAGALHYLGVIAHQMGQNAAAADLIRQALIINPNDAQAYSNLGIALKDSGQLDQAIAAYRQAILINPNYAEAHNNLGNALAIQGHLDEALLAYRLAISLIPNYAAAHANLGDALRVLGQLDDAIAACRQAILLDPNNSTAFNNLANALSAKGLFDDAIAAYRRATSLRPNYPEAYNNLAGALKDTAQLDESIAAYRQAISLAPNLPQAHSNLIYAMHFHPGYDAHAIAEEHRRWDHQYVQPLQKFIQPHTNNRNPNRRLRVGYVSPDFCDHCQLMFTIPLLSAHDPQQVEIICYSDVVRDDARTHQLQAYASLWRNIIGQQNQDVANLIRRDQIDVLVDLTMHMAHNRLLVFAQKPAPVQLSWLAFPGSTGVSKIDYRLSDPYLDPPGTDESVYSELTVRLPDSFWCYDPLEGRDIPVNSLPALETGAITFACLNNFCKINDGVLELWASVLRQVPESRLILLAPLGTHRLRTVDRLSKEGIDPRRIEFIPRQPRRNYLELYHRIDLGLETFPYNGHTTSLDSFWMGVPVPTLPGKTAVGRAGVSILSNIGLPELVARSEEEYVKIAVELARDLPRLTNLRSTLRQRMQQSPLMDAPRFAKSIEAAYRRMWHSWVKSNPHS